MLARKTKVAIFLGVFFILFGCNSHAHEKKEDGMPNNGFETGENVTHKVLYQGSALLVSRHESKIEAENISSSPIAIRISWDGRDPYGTGKGADSYMNNWVPPGMKVNQEIKGHMSAQVWGWGSSGALLDSCSIILNGPMRHQ